MAGWLAGWVVGKSDFNENPVVSPDLDLDFDLGFVNIYVYKAIFCSDVPSFVPT